MPKISAQTLWRARRDAISKKGDLDMEELNMDTEPIIINGKAPLVQQPISSPTSVFQFPERMPELQPLTLPGSWLTVGKGGKVVKPTKMYEEPVTVAKKKKKRTRARKAAAAPEPICALEEAPSASKCVRELYDETVRYEKRSSRGLRAKYWMRYQQEKQVKIHARDVLLASAVFADDEGAVQVPEPLKQRDHKKCSTRDKARRRARDAKAELHCMWPEKAGCEMDGGIGVMAPPQRDTIKAPQDTFKPADLTLSPSSPYVIVSPLKGAAGTGLAPNSEDAKRPTAQPAPHAKDGKRQKVQKKSNCVIS